jgi:hypothetical protein
VPELADAPDFRKSEFFSGLLELAKPHCSLCIGAFSPCCIAIFKPTLYLSLLPVDHVSGRVYKHSKGVPMQHNRSRYRKIIVPVLVILMLCIVVTLEFPELLTLTDNTSNDFAVRRTNTSDQLVLQVSSRHQRSTDVEFYSSAPEVALSHVCSFEKVPQSLSKLFILLSDLRT